jgi:DNA invertase Pin-like site-specific DNA recombinase
MAHLSDNLISSNSFSGVRLALRHSIERAAPNTRLIGAIASNGVQIVNDRPGLEAFLKALRAGDTLVARKLDRLGRDLRHLVNLVHDGTDRGVGLKVLAGQGANLDTATANGRPIFGIFAALAAFERELIIERTRAGVASARARGRSGGRPFKTTAAKRRLAQSAMGQPGTNVGQLCAVVGITRQPLYRHVDPSGVLRADGEREYEVVTARVLHEMPDLHHAGPN